MQKDVPFLSGPAANVCLEVRVLPQRGEPAYESGAPIRFRATALHEGVSIERGAAFNPAPLYPAGQGEALVWIAFDGRTAIDAVHVVAMDARWREIAETTYPVDARWDAAGAQRRRVPAAWARQMSDAQQAMTSQASQESVEDGGWGDLVVAVLVSWIPRQAWREEAVPPR